MDGFVNRDFHHTASAARSWVKIDLGAVQDISTVDIHHRMDCCLERFVNFYVFVSDDDNTSSDPAVLMPLSGWSTWFFAGPKGTLSVPVNRRGRYVRVQLAGTNYLHLSELQVWGQQPALAPMSKPGDRQ